MSVFCVPLSRTVCSKHCQWCALLHVKHLNKKQELLCGELLPLPNSHFPVARPRSASTMAGPIVLRAASSHQVYSLQDRSLCAQHKASTPLACARRTGRCTFHIKTFAGCSLMGDEATMPLWMNACLLGPRVGDRYGPTCLRTLSKCGTIKAMGICCLESPHSANLAVFCRIHHLT